MTHICVDNLTNIGSDNGLSPGRRQAIIWTNVGILLIEPLGTNFSEFWNVIHIFSLKKMHLQMSSAKWRPFSLGLNVLNRRMPQIHNHGFSHHVFWYISLSGVPDLWDHNKILSGGDLSHYQVPHCIRVFFYFVWFAFIHYNFQFILNYVLIVTFWIFTYHKIWILLIIYFFIWNHWIIYFFKCLEVFWSVVC